MNFRVPAMSSRSEMTASGLRYKQALISNSLSVEARWLHPEVPIAKHGRRCLSASVLSTGSSWDRLRQQSPSHGSSSEGAAQ